MEKKRFDFIFIVLVYRNSQDLKEFFLSNDIPNSKTVVVNSYFDDKSEREFKEIAEVYDADFISVPNKGYGAGNNRGIEYALDHYEFDYLIISNADIHIEKIDEKLLSTNRNSIIAPQIRTLRGKKQNPSSPFTPSKIREKFVYCLYKGNHRHLIYLYYIWSRLSKIIYYSISTLRKSIFSPHGAFIIIPFNILLKLHPIFNEKMFLFFEEHHLGQLAKKNNITVRYIPEIKILHKEDGSVGYLSEGIFKYMRQSFLEYYNYWFNNQKINN